MPAPGLPSSTACRGSAALRFCRFLEAGKACFSGPGRRLAAACLAMLAGWMALVCHGQQEAAPLPAAEPGAPAVSPLSEPKRMPPHETLRDPFWPVDFVRPVLPGEKLDPAAAAKIGEAEWRSVEKILRETIKGVSRVPTRSGRDEYLTLINGKLVGVGDSVSLAANGKHYRWKVAGISLRDGPAFERMTTAPPSSGK